MRKTLKGLCLSIWRIQTIKGFIYLHKNKINGKCYVGQTIKDRPEKRWQNGTGYRGNSKFSAAIQKYGWDNFEHIILEKDVPVENLNARENYWIDYYDTISNGYNLIYSCDDNTCHSYSEEMRQKIRKGWTPDLREKQSQRYKGSGNPMYGTSRTGKNAANKKAIVCINTGEIFPTIKEASDWYHIGKNIFKVLKGQQKTAGEHPITHEKLKWRYATQEEKEQIYK